MLEHYVFTTAQPFTGKTVTISHKCNFSGVCTHVGNLSVPLRSDYYPSAFSQGFFLVLTTVTSLFAQVVFICHVLS